MNTYYLPNSFKLSSRLTFQNAMDRAPKANDNFQGVEKQSESEAINEVAPQTPSEIFNDTVKAGAVVQQQYTQGTTSVANLVNTDPVFTGNFKADQSSSDSAV